MEEPESSISIERLESISQKRKIGTFDSASKIEQIRVCGEWIIKVCNKIILPRLLERKVATEIENDLTEIYSAFIIPVVQDRELVEFGKKVREALADISTVITIFELEKSLDLGERIDSIRKRFHMILTCQEHLFLAFEYIRVHLDQGEEVDAVPKTKQLKPSPADPALTPKDSSPADPETSRQSISNTDPSSESQQESKADQRTASSPPTKAPESEAGTEAKIDKPIDEEILKDAMFKYGFPQTDIENLCAVFKLPYDQVQNPNLNLSLTRLFNQAHLKGVYEQLVKKIVSSNPGLVNK